MHRICPFNNILVLLSVRIGRKKALLMAVLIWSASTIVTSFSVNVYMYMAIRFIAGFGGYGTTLAVYVLGKKHCGTSFPSLLEP